jgi:predicted acylesterase/phospholipase RssA
MKEDRVSALTCHRPRKHVSALIKDALDQWTSAVGVMGFPVSSRKEVNSGGEMENALGLVMTGGGARGAYQAGVLKRIGEIKRVQTQGNPFPIIRRLFRRGD